MYAPGRTLRPKKISSTTGKRPVRPKKKSAKKNLKCVILVRSARHIRAPRIPRRLVAIRVLGLNLDPRAPLRVGRFVYRSPLPSGTWIWIYTLCLLCYEILQWRHGWHFARRSSEIRRSKIEKGGNPPFWNFEKKTQIADFRINLQCWKLYCSGFIWCFYKFFVVVVLESPIPSLSIT